MSVAVGSMLLWERMILLPSRTPNIKPDISWSRSADLQRRHLKREVCSCFSRYTDRSPIMGSCFLLYRHVFHLNTMEMNDA